MKKSRLFLFAILLCALLFVSCASDKKDKKVEQEKQEEPEGPTILIWDYVERVPFTPIELPQSTENSENQGK